MPNISIAKVYHEVGKYMRPKRSCLRWQIVLLLRQSYVLYLGVCGLDLYIKVLGDHNVKIYKVQCMAHYLL